MEIECEENTEDIGDTEGDEEDDNDSAEEFLKMKTQKKIYNWK